jgi:hypothetical protein
LARSKVGLFGDPPVGLGNSGYRFRQLDTAARPTPASRAMAAAVISSGPSGSMPPIVIVDSVSLQAVVNYGYTVHTIEPALMVEDLDLANWWGNGLVCGVQVRPSHI